MNIYELGFSKRLYKIKTGDISGSLQGVVDPLDIGPGTSQTLTSGNIVSQGNLATLDTVGLGSEVTGDLDDISNGSTAGKVNLTALTTGNVDLSNAGVTNKTANNITASATRKWAGETGADVTGSHTASDTSNVNSLASSTLIVAGKIGTNLVEASAINVSTLSAISADIGTITSGTITGATVQTSASSNIGVKLTSATGITIYGSACTFKSATSGVYGGTVYGGAGDLYVHSGSGGLELDGGGGGISLVDDCTFSITSTASLNASINITGTCQMDVLRVDQTPTASAPTPSHYITINCNGTLYRMCLDEN